MSSAANDIDFLVTVTPPATGGGDPVSATSVSHKSIEFPLDAEYTIGHFKNGVAWALTATSLSVTDDPLPAYDNSGGALTQIHGSQKNPGFYPGPQTVNDFQGYDGRLTSTDYFSESLIPSYPLSMSPGDVLVKAKSYLSGDDRVGLIDEAGALFVVDTAPSSNALPPPVVWEAAWGPRPSAVTIDWAQLRADFKAVLPVGGYDISSFTNSPPSFTTIEGMIGKFMPLYPQAPGAVRNRGGYEAIGIPYRPGASSNNYGEFFAQDIDTAFAYICSNAPSSDDEIESVLVWMISMGLQWLPSFKGANTPEGGNGGHNQFQFIPCLLAEWALSKDYTDLQTYLPANQLGQTFKWTTALIGSTLVKHTLPSDDVDASYVYRVRDITSVTTDTVTFPYSQGDGDAAQVRFAGLRMYRASDDAFIGVVTAGSGGGGVFTATVAGHGLTTSDQIYFTANYTIEDGDFDWVIRQGGATTGLNTYNPYVLANYRFQQYYGVSAIAAILIGESNPIFENLIGYAHATSDPTSNLFVDVSGGPGSTYPAKSNFLIEFFQTHWPTISA